MKSRFLRTGGFTLIELLVPLAIIAILLELTLPPDQGIREAVAVNAGTEFISSVRSVLCSPPRCDSLGTGTTLFYPTISRSVADVALANGIEVTYDSALLGRGTPFAVFPGETPGLTDPIDVAFQFDPALLDSTDFLLRDVTYTVAGTTRFKVGLVPSGETRNLEASTNGGAVTLSVAASVPEPAIFIQLLLGVAALWMWRSRRPRAGPAI